MLGVARAVSGFPRPSASHLIPPGHHSHQQPQPVEDHGLEDQMEVDLPPAGGPSSSPLAHVWASRKSWCEHADEDLVSDPGSPELSEADEDEVEGNEGLDINEPEFLTDDEETPVHVEISARDQLTADFQLRATQAGMLPCSNIHLKWFLTVSTAQRHLDPDNLDAICTFNYHITKSMTRDTFEGLRHAFPTQLQNIPSLFETQWHVAEISGLKAEYSDCCPKICCCFTSPYENLKFCPFPDC